MYIAELSALDLGAQVEINAVPMGGKYTQYVRGILTEVHHNKTNGYTAVRVCGVPFPYTFAAVESKINGSYGTSRQYPYVTEVRIVEHPLPEPVPESEARIETADIKF